MKRVRREDKEKNMNRKKDVRKKAVSQEIAQPSKTSHEHVTGKMQTQHKTTGVSAGVTSVGTSSQRVGDVVFRWSRRRYHLLVSLVASALVLFLALVGLVVVLLVHQDELQQASLPVVQESSGALIAPDEPCCGRVTNPESLMNGEYASVLAAEQKARISVLDESYDVYVDGTLTVAELLQAAAELRPVDGTGEPFRYETQSYGELGELVVSMMGRDQNPGESEYWTYYIHSEPAAKGISQQLVSAGDIVWWRLGGPDDF